MGPLKEKGAEGVAGEIGRLTGELALIMARTGYESVDCMDAECLYFT